jgi:hypothetical protein
VACVVVEVADGLLQRETAALLRSPRFVASVDAWVMAAAEPLAALGGVQLLRQLGIEPVAISGRLSMSPLGLREAEAATGVRCLSASEIQSGALNDRLLRQRERLGGAASTPMKGLATDAV